MKLIFVRHGETEHNKGGVIQGQFNSKLTRRGIQQAKALARRLSKEKIDIIFSSDLSRAKDTAKAIKKYHKKIPIVYDKLLRERSYGIYENLHFLKYKEMRKKSKSPRYLFKPEKGESYGDTRRRVKKFFKKIYPKYKSKTVLIVAHGGLNRALLSILLKEPLKKSTYREQHNACVNIININRGKVRAHRINCTRHL
ncbi:histidine phosphatase family protein [Candidatus Pacearchaeota archaeon]|nr:histidine phosphatase family protein [Candidatus Pacearchaeota archaeon]